MGVSHSRRGENFVAGVIACLAWAPCNATDTAGSTALDLRTRFSSEALYAEELPADLDFASFERALEQYAFGTFGFYERLTAPNRRLVYEAYRGDGNISAIGVNTLELLRNQ